ncbi:MAG: type IIL restriction-modification enzyme MmeI [Casimicrobiaceae bacterium]
MHNTWVRSDCGRLESDFRYSAGIVHNNFPWPNPSDQHRCDRIGGAGGARCTRRRVQARSEHFAGRALRP